MYLDTQKKEKTEEMADLEREEDVVVVVATLEPSALPSLKKLEAGPDVVCNTQTRHNVVFVHHPTQIYD